MNWFPYISPYFHLSSKKSCTKLFSLIWKTDIFFTYPVIQVFYYISIESFFFIAFLWFYGKLCFEFCIFWTMYVSMNKLWAMISMDKIKQKSTEKITELELKNWRKLSTNFSEMLVIFCLVSFLPISKFLQK